MLNTSRPAHVIKETRMSDKIEVTGYGATEQAARSDAQRKLNDAKMDNAETALMGGAVFAGGNIALTVVGGYLSLLWLGFLCFAARPFVTIVFGTIVFGSAYLILSYVFGISSWDSLYRENPFNELFVKGLFIIFGSFFAGAVASIIYPVTKAFEKEEVKFFKAMPLFLRSPIMVLLMLWPIGIPLWAIAAEAGYSWAGVWEFLQTTPWTGYIIIGVITLIVQCVVIVARLDESSLSQEYTWYGKPQPLEVHAADDHTGDAGSADGAG